MSQSLTPYPAHNEPITPAPLIVDAEQDEGGANLLSVAWGGRWLILLFTLVGGAAAWGYLQQVIPRYTSVARIYVEQSMPKLLNAEAAMGGFSKNHLYTQAELIRSTEVLSAAIQTPETASLPTIRNTDSPVGLLKQELRVMVGKQDDIINISLELPNRNDAASIVNEVVRAYIDKYAEQRQSNAGEVLKILRGEQRRLEQERDAAKQAVEEFREEHVTLAVQSGDDSPVSSLFTTLATELNAAQIQLLEAKTRFRRVQQMLANKDQAPYVMQLAQAAQPDSGGNQLASQIQNLEQQLVFERAEWGEGYPSVKVLRDSLADLIAQRDAQKRAVVRGYVDTLRQEYELLTQRRDELQKAYDQQFELATRVSRDAAKLASLEATYTEAQHYVQELRDQIKGVNLTENVGAMNVSQLEVAQPGYLSYPERPKILASGLAFGAMLGFGLAWVRELLDQRLKSVEEIASTLQTPVLGLVPVLTSGGRRADRRSLGRLVATEPRCNASESIRTLRTTLQFASASGASPRVIVVTSPAPGDGKSTVASNLAITMAQAGQRVLLIDADFRKPTQCEIFATTIDLGAASVLSGVTKPHDAIIPSGIESLDLMPCGHKPPNPVELLNSGRFQSVVSELAELYDQIVIDSPPVMPVADARIIASLGDATLLVLRAERSTRRLALGARDELLKVRAPSLGVVVNAAPLHSEKYSYGYAYGYGYGASVYGDEPVKGSRGRQARRIAERASLEEPLAKVDA